MISYIGSHLKIVAYLRQYWLLYSKISSIWHQPGYWMSFPLGLDTSYPSSLGSTHIRNYVITNHHYLVRNQGYLVFRIFPCFFTFSASNTRADNLAWKNGKSNHKSYPQENSSTAFFSEANSRAAVNGSISRLEFSLWNLPLPRLKSCIELDLSKT